MSPIVLIESNDSVFAEKIAKTLDQWGFRHQQLGADTESDLSKEEGDVVLLDVRDLADDAFGQVYSTRQQFAGVEVVLINKPDNVVASIAGMKAGAVDEIIVPFDTGTLKTIITEAYGRVQAAREKKSKKPLLARFSDAMLAATFAQAGDFKGALEFMDSDGPGQTSKTPANKKNRT